MDIPEDDADLNGPMAMVKKEYMDSTPKMLDPRYTSDTKQETMHENPKNGIDVRNGIIKKDPEEINGNSEEISDYDEEEEDEGDLQEVESSHPLTPPRDSPYAHRNLMSPYPPHLLRPPYFLPPVSYAHPALREQLAFGKNSSSQYVGHYTAIPAMGGSPQTSPPGNSSPSELSPGQQDLHKYTYEEQFKQGAGGSAEHELKKMKKMLYELDDKPGRREFLDDLFKFMQQKGNPVTRIPIMAKQVLDLYELFNLVVARGGLVEVINKKIWREITKGLNLPSSITSAAFTLRTQYMKYLYAYECEKYHYSTPEELQTAIEGNKREGRKPSLGCFPASGDSPRQSLVPPHLLHRPHLNGGGSGEEDENHLPPTFHPYHHFSLPPLPPSLPHHPKPQPPPQQQQQDEAPLNLEVPRTNGHVSPPAPLELLRKQSCSPPPAKRLCEDLMIPSIKIVTKSDDRPGQIVVSLELNGSIYQGVLINKTSSHC